MTVTTAMIRGIVSDSIEMKRAILGDSNLLQQISQAGEQLQTTMSGGGTIYSCGNGGSACDAMHLTEELVARFRRDRRGIRAMHFLDPAVMSCWSNDHDFAAVFSRQAETFCANGDTLVAISTSGNSENVVAGVQAARKKGAKVIGLLGRGGGELRGLVDIPIVIPCEVTERVQEAHILVIHIFCEILDRALTEGESASL